MKYGKGIERYWGDICLRIEENNEKLKNLIMYIIQKTIPKN